MNQIDGVISVKDLFAELVRKCWLIIICAFVFAVALGGYKLVGNLQAQKNVDEVVSELTEEEIEAVEDYVAKEQELDSLEAYIDDSILLNLNPFDVYRTELQFIITGEADAKELSTIRAAYADYALFGRLASDIAEEYGDYEEMALEDIIETDADIREQDPDLRTVRIMILAQNEEQAKELTSCVKEQIAEYTKEVSQSIGAHEFKLIDENTFHYFKSDLVGRRDYFDEQFEKMKTEVEELANQLTDVQKNYALELLGEENEETDEPTKQGIGLKSILLFAILGGVLGGVAAVALIAAWYILTSTIKSVEEIKMVYGIRCLGHVSTKKKNICEIWADKIFYASKISSLENQKELLYSKILMTCETENIQEFVLTGAFEKNENHIDELQKKLEGNGIQVKVVGDFVKKPEALNELKGNKNILFAETLRKSSYDNVHQKINLCKEQNINILGYIIFE